MAIQQSAALLKLIDFIKALRSDSDVMDFVKTVKGVDEVQRGSTLVPALPMLQLLTQVLTVEGDAFHPDFSPVCSKFNIEKLKSIAQRADEISVREAVMTNLGGAMMVNPVAFAMLAAEGISVVITHDCEDYADEADIYVPSVYYVTKDFVL
ncbi:hypothetical protein KTD31_01580 [Burkholderia multivorans]|jgi:hypothetical protein|uniref:hypothetical protein n=1 Tax=Burkholderia multivorans TaxID=87883 RepID=UPI001C249B57|nr:hypothetical protein [Burkholderia multivorans]MBU9200093.1 hypothetical protein [Burkholderia multivorans]MDN8078785.1 hypothetical protein [Burkholderia multivorans]